MKKIFYSWQSDTPREIGKNLIRDALDDAVDQVAAELELEDAARPEVDQDTQGVLGAPAIAETILAKIKAADLVVADVTLTGRATVEGTIGEKAFLNSNVAIELGAALGARGDEVLLQVMNTHYGAAKQLPFDLVHRRFPVEFNLAPGAAKPALEKERRALAKKFAGIIGEYVKAKAPPPAVFERRASNGNPAVYWRDGDPLVDLGRRQLKVAVTTPMIYLRLSPGTPIPQFSGVEIADPDFTHARPLIYEAVPHSPYRNDYGMIHYFRPENRREDGEDFPDLGAWTQVFRNRELWGVNAMQLHAVWNERIEMDHLERHLIDGLQDYLSKADAFGYPALVHFEAGVVFVRGMRVSLANGGLRSEPLREDFITHEARFDRRELDAWKVPLLALFEKIFDEAAQHRPKNLKGFPDG